MIKDTFANDPWYTPAGLLKETNIYDKPTRTNNCVMVREHGRWFLRKKEVDYFAITKLVMEG